MKRTFETITNWLAAKYTALAAVFFPGAIIEDAREAQRLKEFDLAIWRGLISDLGSADDAARMRAIRAIENDAFAPGFRSRNPDRAAQLATIASTEVMKIENRQTAEIRRHEISRMFR